MLFRSVDATVEGGFNFRHIIDSGVRGPKSDIGVLATTEGDDAMVMLWNYHDDYKAAPDATTEITVTGLKGRRVIVEQYLLDRNNNNSYEVWKEMGSPQNPTPEQYATLEKTGKLHPSGKEVKMRVKNGTLVLKTTLQRQSVSLVSIKPI